MLKTLRCLITAIILFVGSVAIADADIGSIATAYDEPKELTREQRLEQIQKRRAELYEIYAKSKIIVENLRKMEAVEAEMQKIDAEERKILNEQTRELEKQKQKQKGTSD
jgi:hypothetical protein